MAIETTAATDAVIQPVRTISKIWLFPIAALLIGLWMVYHQWSNQGPLIIIEFATATGLEAGKTKIKTRDVDIGIVKTIELTSDLEGVLVTARLNSNVESILHADNQFWIVSPRITLSGVSGLGTILSGPYINMELGLSSQSSVEFVALAAPPVTPGLHVTLNSNSEFAYKKGDPVIYKGIQVGEFEDIHFNFDERIVYYNTFIKAPYHELITTNTKFWDISGFQMELNANGVKVNTGSIETILTNGVTFGVPDKMPAGEIITERSYFDIHSSYELAAEERFVHNAKYILLVEDTVRGLQVGAPVEYRGLVIGKVLAINIPLSSHQGLLEDSYDIPILIGIQPGRVGESDDDEGLKFVHQQIDHWITKGLRATLKTGNILTGSLFVDLQHYDNLATIKNTEIDDLKVLPFVSDEFSQITDKVSSILDNINALKLQDLSENTNKMLLQITKAAESLQLTGTNIDTLLSRVEQERVAHKMSLTLESINALTRSYSEDSETNQRINQTMTDLQQTMKELRPILLQLNNTPNSLIFTGSRPAGLFPKAKQKNKRGVAD
ncbi:intermembrane transport protein PqiB [Paraglaciecola sp. L3A3]|uniref:intermembrane transport protein PqiB n=1 Tax=Paraglaciecola sp. L3A3 TaxID=2686358 RepID=UPI00131E0093|nr:intermembrane transport protein PqiB [Paraglaciecola sp. L3A3]